MHAFVWGLWGLRGPHLGRNSLTPPDFGGWGFKVATLDSPASGPGPSAKAGDPRELPCC